MLDNITLKNYYAMARNWMPELIRNFDKVLGMTENEAIVLVHLYRNKGSYVNRIVSLLTLKQSTASAILWRFSNQKVVFSQDSPISGNKIYKLTDKPLAKAYLSAAFILCICKQLKEGVDENGLFT